MTSKERLGIDRRCPAFSFKTQCHDEALEFVTLAWGMDRDGIVHGSQAGAPQKAKLDERGTKRQVL